MRYARGFRNERQALKMISEVNLNDPVIYEVFKKWNTFGGTMAELNQILEYQRRFDEKPMYSIVNLHELAEFINRIDIGINCSRPTVDLRVKVGTLSYRLEGKIGRVFSE